MNGPKWTTEETSLLIKSFKLRNKQLSSLFPRRSLNAVLNKMHNMGLERPFLPIDRFLKFVETDNNGCWVWVGCKQGKHPWQYGSFGVNGKIEKAHHFSYEFYRGPVPEGMLVCHTCDNPPCVNPDHLFLGTALDNTQDMIQKGRSNFLRGSKKANALLTENTVINIRNDPRPVVEIARELGVSSSCIYDAKSRSWKHVPGAKKKNLKVTDGEVVKIRADNRPHIEIAKEYGISRCYVSTLKSGIWRKSASHD